MTRGYETLPKHRYRPEPFSNLVSITETKMQSLYGQEQGDVILEIQQFYGTAVQLLLQGPSTRVMLLRTVLN